MQQLRVVLVRPQIAANLGATARVMRNMGVSDLVLVEPVADPRDREARRLSTHGEEILDRCRTVAALADALADCLLVLGTSARTQGIVRGQSLCTPEEIAPRAAGLLARGPVAVVFGPEPSGLSTAEITLCHALMTIPTDPTYPALNLAQAVAISLHALRTAWLRGDPAAAGRPAPAPFADRERMFEQLRHALEQVHFLYDRRADGLMHALRHLIGRADPTAEEVRILQGLARQIRWYVENHPPRGPAP